MHKEDETNVQGMHFKGLMITDLELRNCAVYTYWCNTCIVVRSIAYVYIKVNVFIYVY